MPAPRAGTDAVPAPAPGIVPVFDEQPAAPVDGPAPDLAIARTQRIELPSVPRLRVPRGIEQSDEER